MASTSTSSVPKSFMYDVFLSFRGEDTRNTFVGHLYNALEQNGIETYKDDEKIEKGKTIHNQLSKSVEYSRFFIIVFSKDYAGSSWCLDELVKIMECHKTSEQTAYPVFYDVEPTEVRKQSGAVGEAFSRHVNDENAGKWRDALKEAGKLAGWELKKTANGDESKLIQIIVDVFFKKICSSSSSFDGNLVGMETRIEDVLSSLELDVDDVRMIGIWGIGGGGKTTLARAVFDRISILFDGKAFVENVREVSESSLYGLNKLQEQVLSSVLCKENINVSSIHEGINMMKKMMRRRKVLIVLDDVDDTRQLEVLAGSRDWFKFGSRVIITTRDKQVLLAHRVNLINDVNLLSHAEAISLFSKYAFIRDIPSEGYEELSKQVVQYANGLPLTIKVLGSLLCGQNMSQWIDMLERLKKIPLKATMEKLELSYDGLEEDYKEIFLDVACLLKGWHKDDAIRALESCGFFAEVGLRVLEQRSLIVNIYWYLGMHDHIEEMGKNIVNIYWYLGMHDHIEEMGKNIVRRQNPNNPKWHSRLWIEDEIIDILANNMGTDATRCIKLYTTEFNDDILLAKGLANMKELRFLDVYRNYANKDEVSNRNFDEVSLYLPNSLRFLKWFRYPFSSLPKTFQAKNLVGLEMFNSNIIQLWKDVEEKACLKLRFLKFAYSQLRTLDLRVAPNLETLLLEKCDNLVEVHFEVTPNLKELRILHCNRLEKLHMHAKSLKLQSPDLNNSMLRNLRLGITPNLETPRFKKCIDMVKLHMPAECPKLVNLDLSNLQMRTLHLTFSLNLERLSLYKCTDMVKLNMPVECPKLINLNLYKLKLRTLHLGITPNLEMLRVKKCTDMVELHMPAECPKLVNLDLSFLKVKTLHLPFTLNLERLCLYKCTDVVELHMPAEYPKLVNLDLSFLKVKTLHLPSTPNLERLSLYKCTDMVELHMPAECQKLVNLDLSLLKVKTLHLTFTSNLERLSLYKCTDMVELHMPAECSKLVNLDLYKLNLRTLHLGTTPNLETLSLYKCTYMVELRMPADCPKLVNLYLSKLKLKTLHLGIVPNLETLRVHNCTHMVELHITAECPKLVTLHLDGNAKLRTLDLGLTPNLESLDLYNCYDLEEINAPAQCLKKLLHLDISNCGRFESFEFDIELDSTEVVSLSELHLTANDIGICDPGNTWPEFTFSGYYKEDPDSSFGNLERLISLGFSAHINIDSFPDIICDLQCLRKLTLEGGIREAPKNLDQLDCLEELIFSSTKMGNLPDSICKMKHLKSLQLKSCLLLKKLPDDLGRIGSLETLIITNCNRLRDIPNNMGKIECVISPKVYKRYTHGKFKQQPKNDAVDRSTGSDT